MLIKWLNLIESNQAAVKVKFSVASSFLYIDAFK